MGNSQSTPNPSYGNDYLEASRRDTSTENLTTSDNEPFTVLRASDGFLSDPTTARRSLPRRSIYDSLRWRNPQRHPVAEIDNLQVRTTDEETSEQEERLVDTMNDSSRPLVATMVDDQGFEPDRWSRALRRGSRRLPDLFARGILRDNARTSNGDRGIENLRDQRSRLSRLRREVGIDSGTRFSPIQSIRRRLEDRYESRTDIRRHTIRGPFPLGQTHHQLLNGENTNSLDIERHELPSSQTPSDLMLSRSNSRLRRIRASLSTPFTTFFTPLQPRSNTPPFDRNSSGRSARVTLADDSDQLLPPLTSTDHRVEIDDSPHELDAVESEARNALSVPRVTSGMSTIRRFPHGLRSRSTRLIRRGEHPPLSQVLQLAAAAIAAQLSGHANVGTGSGRALAGDAFDGSIQNFVQTLQDAASAQAGENIDVNAADGDLPPVNFMRVFQFPNDENGSPITSQAQSRDVEPTDIDQVAGPSENNDRSVTLVLVGVRSMPNGQDNATGETGTLGPSLDTLLSLPFLPPANVLRNGSSGALFRRSDGRARTNARRHSMTNFSFPAQYESQRHHRTRTPAGRSSIDQPLLTTPGTLGSVIPESDSPPGPHPPPSTPADIRSGQATPLRRPSSASAAHGTSLPELDEVHTQLTPDALSENDANAMRQRRRSDSEFARRPELGSGAARRNGVVEPDHPTTGMGRSWLIYVVGTNVSPDHPAFTMPSLFTDNPSYEDMQMLSTLLGPVKPPVATHDEVATAGGLFRLVMHNDGFVGHPTSNLAEAAIDITMSERCLICLCDYEVAEEVRQLNRCQHVFHRICIDEWLTTGRNSCPMCRAQGVGEKDGGTSQSPDSRPPFRNDVV